MDTFSLEPYIQAISQNWLRIGIVAALAAALALGVTLILEQLAPTYAATSLVTLNESTELLQFDPRFESLREAQPLGALPDIAQSDDVLTALLQSDAVQSSDVGDLRDLRESVTARAANDPNLIRLTVENGDAATASAIANEWAALFVTQANALYGDQSGTQVVFFTTQLAEAESSLILAEDALELYQASNRLPVVNSELEAILASQAALNERRIELQQLQVEVAVLAAPTTANSDDAALADQLTLLLLQLQAFAAPPAEGVELNIDASTFVADAAAFTAAVDTLETRLAALLTGVDAQLDAMEPQILALRAQRETLNNEEARLQLDVSLARTTVEALANQLAEERISAADTTSGVQLASQAAVPIEPVRPRPLLNGALAGVAALLLMLSYVLYQASMAVTHDNT